MRIFRTDCVKLLYKISVLSKCVYSFYVVIISLHRSSRPEVFCKKCFLRKCAKFTRNTFARTLLKKRLWHRCFPVNFAKCLRTSYRTLPVAPSVDNYLVVVLLAETNQNTRRLSTYIGFSKRNWLGMKVKVHCTTSKQLFCKIF